MQILLISDEFSLFDESTRESYIFSSFQLIAREHDEFDTS
jgi:hypothetical protein